MHFYLVTESTTTILHGFIYYFRTASLVSATPNYLAALVKVVAGSFGPLVQGGVYGPKYLVRIELLKMHEAVSNQRTTATCYHEECAALSDHTTRPC